MTNKKITPFYDPEQSYANNCKNGPFGGFADGEIYKNSGEPQYTFCGEKVFFPFGIPAGPIPNANFCKGAFEKGFDIVMYKTVRTRPHPCNPFPNIVPVQTDGKLTLEQAQAGLVTAEKFENPIAITNSFGVPSVDPEEWIPDMTKAVQMAGKGQVLVATYQGTNRGEGEEAFIQDWVDGAEMIMQTGAKIVELDLSCPNEGKSALLCHDTERVVKIVQAIQPIFEEIPVLIKISYFPSQEKLKDFIAKVSPYIAGFNAINTIAGDVRNPDGTQALPGEGRLTSGVCGAPIKWAGLDMVSRMADIREELNTDFVLIGTGGVTTPDDFDEYLNVGADAVMSATGSMWNTDLAQEIKNEFL